MSDDSKFPPQEVLATMAALSMERAMRSLAKIVRVMAPEAAGLDGKDILMGLAEGLDTTCNNSWPVHEEPFQ